MFNHTILGRYLASHTAVSNLFTNLTNRQILQKNNELKNKADPAIPSVQSD